MVNRTICAGVVVCLAEWRTLTLPGVYRSYLLLWALFRLLMLLVVLVLALLTKLVEEGLSLGVGLELDGEPSVDKGGG